MPIPVHVDHPPPVVVDAERSALQAAITRCWALAALKRKVASAELLKALAGTHA